MRLLKELNAIIDQYRESFTAKEYNDENNEYDLLMDLYGITPEIKRENRQYWGRELGMLWELIVCKIFEMTTDEYKPKERIGNDSPYDFIYKDMAIDTKYRIGSGDSGTLKKFKKYATELREMNLVPVILLLREDSLQNAITACINGGWEIYTGDDCLRFIYESTGFDVKDFLEYNKGRFLINRKDT